MFIVNVQVFYRTRYKKKCYFLLYEISHNVNFLHIQRRAGGFFRNKHPQSQVDSLSLKLSVPVRYLVSGPGHNTFYNKKK